MIHPTHPNNFEDDSADPTQTKENLESSPLRNFLPLRSTFPTEMDLVKYSTFPMIISLSGIWGIFPNRRNITIMSMPIESMLLAVNSNLSVFPVYPDDMMGQLFALSVLTVAAAESAIGSAIPVITFRIRRTIAVESINRMKGRAALIIILLVRNKKLLVPRFLRPTNKYEEVYSSDTSAYSKVPITLASANPTKSELTYKAPAPSIGAQLFYFILFSQSSGFFPILFVP